eukprot:237331-Rhodomonas_salina.2
MNQIGGRPYVYQLPVDRPELGKCPVCALDFVAGDERVLTYTNYMTERSRTAWAHVFCCHHVFNNMPWNK